MVIDTNKANEEFWNELCGSVLAFDLGIKDHSLESLKRFDRGYLEIYPYLLSHVDLRNMTGKKVLEIGLGYGTLGQKIAESGADYIGMDIAEGPVKMMSHRLKLQGLPGNAIKGNFLECPFGNESFDYVVSIGCFHHTGNVQRCFDETYRILRHGGASIVMVYNQYSLRQWLRWPKNTLAAFLNDMGVHAKQNDITGEQKEAYDANSSGNAAPETIFLSIKQLKKMLVRFSDVKFHKENCDPIYISRFITLSRPSMLPIIGKLMGLDIYIEARK